MLRHILDNFRNATAIHATYAIPDESNAPQIARIARVQIASPTKVGNQASDEIISNWWLLHYADRESVQVAIWPPCNHGDVLALNPQTIAAEPIPSPIPKHKPIASAIELLDTMREVGFTVRLLNGDLDVGQSRWIDDELASLIKQHKMDLIKLLESKIKNDETNP